MHNSQNDGTRRQGRLVSFWRWLLFFGAYFRSGIDMVDQNLKIYVRALEKALAEYAHRYGISEKAAHAFSMASRVPADLLEDDKPTSVDFR